jgi:hypothetical protein
LGLPGNEPRHAQAADGCLAIVLGIEVVGDYARRRGGIGRNGVNRATRSRIELEESNRDAAEGIEAGALFVGRAIRSAHLVQLDLHDWSAGAGRSARQRVRRNRAEEALPLGRATQIRSQQ